ncbi:MAG: hypothetical protein AAGH60_00560 [Pseudomonadota bacterium]
MSDLFAAHMAGLESPASNAFTIVAQDNVPLTTVTRAIYIGAGGDLSVKMKSGETVVFTGVPAGSVLPVRVAEVAATGTSASNLVGLA